ncbi:IS4 family transposase [Clostridium pasteurianum]|uniref:Transposase family protein n=1 Tax=Clostridium pasteurianum BC1 TaxID=86416 RepID=R4K7A6_CLOPA|nr:IS4 family transposase [Clostridium pasteurianum]AGK96083.1 transposase family protein [Clostridium pasteurianum BC1]AGK96452.1 transposase family protein [Clostridium pasteurianum BC1]AGK97540.1 transposase family protein [Clostridium pasteurianum BC1]AGK97581.1 transposase family protein [Clostridium pasteurianum BC1]AGK97785.1 transposase family protein [Clostridium pasteurianum BC1]
MLNNQEYITAELGKMLYEILPISSKKLKNLVYIVLGILLSKSVIISEISEKLKDYYTEANEESKIKRIYRFFSSSTIKSDYLYYNFIDEIMINYIKRSTTNKLVVIFDHTTLEDKFLILKFSLKVGKRAVPLWYKIFEYNEKDNKNFKHIKQGIEEIKDLISSYNYEVVLLADRGFKSIDLFKFINKIGWKYCIRCTNDMLVNIEGKEKIKYLRDIKTLKKGVKKFNGILLSAEKYRCNLAVCKAEEAADTWYIVTNLDSKNAVNEYKKRFIIEEMFRDLKSSGFNMEDTWTNSLIYFENLYLCLCIAYTWMIILGADCSKNKKSKIIGATKKIRNKIVRIYSLFSSGLTWFNRCYDSNRKKYALKFNLILYDI